MRATAFAAWALFVLLFYFRRAWALLASGAGLDAGTPDARAALLPLALLAIASSALVAIALEWRARRLVLASAGLVAVMAGALLVVTGRASLPYGAEAASRAAQGLSGAGVVLFAAWGFGALIPRLPTPEWQPLSPERLLFRLAAGFAVLVALSGLLAAAGHYTPTAVRLALGAGAAAGFAALAGSIRRNGRARATAGPVVMRANPAAPSGPPRPPALPAARPRGADLAWLGLSVLALAVAFTGALAPETEYDALWYHLWLPRQWLAQGSPFDTAHEFVTLYPMNWDLVFGAGLTTGGEPAAKLLHFTCLPLLGLAAWQTVRRFFPAASPWLAAAITVTAPTVLWEATTAYVDLALALYVMLALYALLSWREGRGGGWFWLAAFCLGFAAGIKHLGLVVLGAAVAAATLDPPGACPREAGTAGTARGARQTRSRWARGLLAAAALGATAVALAVPWYLRAWDHAGNPFFPELFDVFGAWPAERWDAVSERGLDGFKARFGVPRTPLELVLLPWTVTLRAARFGGTLGPAPLLLLPLLAWAAWRDRRARWLTGIAAGYAVVWASPLSSFQVRFLVPVVAPAAVVAAHGWALIQPSFPTAGRRLAHAGLALVLLLDLPPFIPWHEGHREADGWLTHVVREVPLRTVVGRTSAGEYLRERVPAYAAWQYLDTAAPPGARVLVAGSRHNFYATRVPISTDAPAARGAWSAEPADVEAALRRLGIRYVIVERAWLRSLREPLPALATVAFRRDRLRCLYEDVHALVYFVGGDAPKASSSLPGRGRRPRAPAMTRSLRTTCRTAIPGA